MMRLFLDECLSPKIAQSLNAEGIHVALHPRDFGGLGASDYHVLVRCIEQDLVLVTANARGRADFKGHESSSSFMKAKLGAYKLAFPELLFLNYCKSFRNKSLKSVDITTSAMHL